MHHVKINDKYGDTLELTNIGQNALDLTITEGVGEDEETSSCVILDDDGQRELRRFLGVQTAQVASRPMTDPNEAKLRVAAQFDLRARFDYQGSADTRPYPRRLMPETVFSDADGDVLVTGESFDENGRSEGFRQFRLDRISGPVTVR